MSRVSNFRLRLGTPEQKKLGLIALASFVLDDEVLVDYVEVWMLDSQFSVELMSPRCPECGEIDIGPNGAGVQLLVAREVLNRLGPLLGVSL
jgi:hypothetical protein